MFDNPLSVSILIYITSILLILYTKPSYIFNNNDENTLSEYINNKNIWLFFILYAIIVYSGVCVYMSSKSRQMICDKLNSSGIEGLKDICKS